MSFETTKTYLVVVCTCHHIWSKIFVLF